MTAHAMLVEMYVGFSCDGMHFPAGKPNGLSDDIEQDLDIWGKY